eukprot:1576810-Ditylum_brightwellii.AAC.1
MDTQVQHSLEWIKAQITATNNNMTNFKNQTLQALKNQNKENSKVIEQMKEEGRQRDINLSITVHRIQEMLEGMRGTPQPQTSFSSVHQQL